MGVELERNWKEAESRNSGGRRAAVARQQPVNTLPCQQSSLPSLANGRQATTVAWCFLWGLSRGYITRINRKPRRLGVVSAHL
jgi:hypothetical protein